MSALARFHGDPVISGKFMARRPRRDRREVRDITWESVIRNELLPMD